MRASRIFILLLLLFSGLTSLVLSQSKKSRSKLENQQSQIQKDIQIAQEALNGANKKREATLAKVSTTRQLVSMRRALIQSLNKEINYLEEDANELSYIITAMQHDLDSLQGEYAEMIYQASKVNRNLNKLTLIYTSKSFNQLTMRLKFLEEVSEAREIQVRKIKVVKASLEDRNKDLQKKYEEKRQALAQVKQEKSKLDHLLADQATLAKDLQSKEEDIRKRIKKLQQEQARVKKLIEDIIAAESAAPSKLSAKFELNKGRLPWPVSRCFITHKFGKQRHPDFKDIWINNLGVGLQTPQKNAPVRAVFEGKVVSVASVPGVGKVVMIRHGNYFTVYSGLVSTSVLKDQTVQTKSSIGQVKTNTDGVQVLEFQIWKGKNPIDPSAWLAK